MKFKLQTISLLIVAGITYLVGQFFSNPSAFGFCLGVTKRAYICLADAAINIGWPLIAAGEVLAIAGIILLFANERGLQSWWRMSRWFLPISAIVVIFLAPAPIFPIVAPVARDTIVWLLGILYILTTLVVVVRNRLRAD